VGEDSAAVIAHVAYRAPLLAPGKSAWAVLCAGDSAREVLVYAEPVHATSAPVARLRLRASSAEEGCENWIGLLDARGMRAVVAADKRRGRAARLRRAERARPLHAGLVDGLCEGEGSVVRYWTGARWATLPRIVRDAPLSGRDDR
jgi:hypothetical protein